jgi:hypothetical protein
LRAIFDQWSFHRFAFGVMANCGAVYSEALHSLHAF